MKIGIAAGHSMNTDNPERRFEWQCCFEAELRLSRLLQAEGHEVVRPPRDFAYFGESGHLFRFQSGHPWERSDAGLVRMG